MKYFRSIALVLSFGAVSCGVDLESKDIVSNSKCDVELIVLGVGQDAGAPQIANNNDPAWEDPSLKLLATSLAIVDHRSGAHYLFEATPNISEQLNFLSKLVPSDTFGVGLDGVFITHAHIGHYAGLMFLGREAAGAKDIKVYAMPRLANYFQNNGPWDQLVSLNNITISNMKDRDAIALASDLSVTPYRVPHRDEYSETVGYVINVTNKSVLFIPDIDSWDEWETDFGIKIEAMIEAVDFAYLDSTFYDDNELNGRDMSQIPHPRVKIMMERFESLPQSEKNKVQFIHMNHTNPIRFRDSEETFEVKASGFNIARRGDRKCLAKSGS